MKKLKIAAKTTLYLVIFLVFIGSIVRVTGAGMGCPDWPTCFGKLIPPTSVSELPKNYQEIYKNHGYANTPFSPIKTWTEYLNRLLGVLVGISTLITWILSFKAPKNKRKIIFLSTAILLSVLLQGWLGAKVVKSNLVPGIITAHMALAMIIVGILVLLIHTLEQKKSFKKKKSKTEKIALKILSLALFIQVILGTQVREQIDHITNTSNLSRTEWIENLNILFPIHRSFSILIVLITLLLLKERIKRKESQLLKLPTPLIVTIGTGISMAYAGIPMLMQSFHLLFATLSLTILFFETLE